MSKQCLIKLPTSKRMKGSFKRKLLLTLLIKLLNTGAEPCGGITVEFGESCKISENRLLNQKKLVNGYSIWI